MGTEKLHRNWTCEAVKVQRFGERAYGFNIEYWNGDYVNFILSNQGVNTLYKTIDEAIKKDKEIEVYNNGN